MDQDAYRNEIVSAVRSCLVSVKGNMSVRQLEDDYHGLMGERIPYQKLGFQNIITFLRSVPSLVVTKTNDGIVMVDAKVSEQSAHISGMVSRQRSVPKKKPRRQLRYNDQHRHNPWRIKTQVNLTPRKHYQATPRLAAMAHNQFIKPKQNYNKQYNNNNYSNNNNIVKKAAPPMVASKVVVPETSSYSNNTNGVVNGYSKDSKEVGEPVARVSTPPTPPTPPTPQKSNSMDEDERCSPLVNTKKRITKLMAEIDLDRDSGNSSPTCEVGTTFRPSFPDFITTGDPIADLRTFASLHKLGEVVVKFSESIAIQSKRKKIVQYHCKIQIDDSSYTSYPNDFADRVSAERFTSQKALDDLIIKQRRRRSLLISSPEDIITRIPPMLEKYMSAIWNWQIELDYIDAFNEQLPANWLQVVDSSPHVNLEKQQGGHILHYCKSGETFQKGLANQSTVLMNESVVSVPCNTVQYDDDNLITAIVTCPMSPGEIWCQQTGTVEYDTFLTMAATMNAFYATNKENMRAVDVSAGSCYVIEYEEGNWLRVRALTPPIDGVISCILIDYGDDCDVPMDAIYNFKREFASSMAQAFVGRLVGLEDFYNVTSESLQLLKNKEVDLKIVENELADLRPLSLPVVMYEKNESISLNEELVTSLTIDAAAPILNKDSVTEVYVTNIYKDGEAYVQVRNAGHADLMEMLARLGDEVDRNPKMALVQPVTRENCQDRLYLVRSSTMQKWMRAAVMDWAPHMDLAQFEFVDVGSTEVFRVNRDVIYPLDLLDDVINQYPPQAVKVRMMIDSLPTNFEEMAKKLMPLDEKLMLKIVSYDNENVPWVEFFKKSSDGLTVCINKSITLENELNTSGCNPSDDVSNKRLLNLMKYNETSMSKKMPSGGSLDSPYIPNIGEYFEVNISFAVSPWNFFVQPLSTEDDLIELMASMQDRYKDSHLTPLPIEDIQPGNIYASKYETGFWYRTSVLKVIHPGSISVFYCDYGYYANLSVHQLVPLDSSYKKLPHQAIKAKLAGVKPINKKWNMDDCDFFKNLVSKNRYVSLIKNISKDEPYSSDLVIELHLIDTSTDEDVQIMEVLVNKGMAAVAD